VAHDTKETPTVVDTDALLAAAERYAETFDAGDLAPHPRRGLAVLTCMDARIHPERIFGLEVGDAHVLRNAGGRVTDDVLRSLVLSDWVLDTRAIFVIHHTACGVGSPEPTIRDAVREAGGPVSEGMRFHGFEDLEGSVRDDVEVIRSSGLLPDDIEVLGFVFEVETGRLRQVQVDGG
jgi:carbonic anhydrase